MGFGDQARFRFRYTIVCQLAAGALVNGVVDGADGDW